MEDTPRVTLDEAVALVAKKGLQRGEHCVLNHAAPHDPRNTSCNRQSTHVLIERRVLPDGSRPVLPACADHGLGDSVAFDVFAWDALDHHEEHLEPDATPVEARISSAFSAMPFGGSAHFHRRKFERDGSYPPLTAEQIADNLERLRDELIEVAEKYERRGAELRALKRDLRAVGRLLALATEGVDR